MKISRPIVLGFFVVSLSGCNLKVVTSDGGSVQSDSGSIDCGTLCIVSHTASTAVTETLTAQPDLATGYRFDRWTGPCKEADLTQPVCTVQIGAFTGDKTIQAFFVRDSGYEISSFEAQYFDDETIVGSETVRAPAINYLYQDFMGIDSYDFAAQWTGTLEVFGQSELININVDALWSDVVVLVDGQIIQSWSNSARSIPHTFTNGVHSIEIRYANNWHTTGFNVSFSSQADFSAAELAQEPSFVLPENASVFYVGAYESGQLHNDVTLSLAQVRGPVLLFLSTYRAVNWIIENPDNVDIVAVVHNAYAPESTVTVAENVPTYIVSDLDYGYSTFDRPNRAIQTITGRSADYAYGQYELNTVQLGAIQQ